MRFDIKKSETKTGGRSYKFVPKDVKQLGVPNIYQAANLKYEYAYCKNCDTWYLLLDTCHGHSSEQYDSYLRMLNGDGTDAFVSERRELTQRSYEYDKREEEGGIDPWFKKDDQIIVERVKYEISEPIIEHGKYSYSIKQTYRLKDDFLDSRGSFDRIEVISSENDSCIYCEKKFVDLMKSCDEIYENRLALKCEMDAIAYVEECMSMDIDTQSDVPENPDIKKFLTNVIDIDSSIQLLCKSLGQLMLLGKDFERKALKEKCKREKEGTVEIDRVILAKRKEMESNPALLNENVTPEEIGLVKPSEPAFEKPSLFNKKKVEESNRILEERYRLELEVWQKAIVDKVAEEVQRRKNANEEMLKRKEQRDSELAREIAALEKEKEAMLSNDSGFYSNVLSFYTQEIEDIKKKIIELCQVRAKLLATNIIYKKYTDFIALTTISEYFEIGKCDSLTGANGAYNLYDQESRENRIITQLDSVVDSLEQIKATQYKTYEKICSIEKNTARMADRLDKVAETMQSMDKNIEKIRDNTEITAYYSEKTAMYSKMQAQMTDALGYLVAFR